MVSVQSETVSRFRPEHDRSPQPPYSVGLCQYCRREIWANGDTARRAGLDVVVSDATGTQCVTCQLWQARHPGRDPRNARGTAAERLRVEGPEPDPSWREDDRACEGLPIEPFAPELDRDDPVWRAMDDATRAELVDERMLAARRVCGPCPVREACAETALAMGYEGLWGGAFYRRRDWENLITGAKGHTIHSSRGGSLRQGAA